MSFFKIKRDLADKLFSDFIRKRDGKCVRCGKGGTLQCSHYWGRRMESVRFDPLNAEALCFTCHERWEHQKEIWIDNDMVMGEYAKYKVYKLGQRMYDGLKIKAHQRVKKDRAMELIKIKALLKTL